MTCSPVPGEMPVSARMVEPCDTSTRLAPRGALRSLRSSRICRSRFSCRPKRLSSGRATSALPKARRAVSRQRHQGLESTRATGIRLLRNSSPMRRACCRPSSERLRCVPQSSSRMPGGSPLPGVVTAWRMRITCPPPSSRDQSASLASAAPGEKSSRRNAILIPAILRHSRGMATPFLFQPLELRGVRLRNRIVISPMCQYSAHDGMVADWHLVHLGKFAQGGAGAVFVEATAVEKRGRITHGDTGIWDDAHIAGLRRISSFLKDSGAVPAIQLAHAGRKASMARPWYGNGPLTQEDLDRGDHPWSINAPTEAPIDSSWITPRAMKAGDCQAVLGAYRNAARRAHAAGFDILEVHAAHGYLLHSFLSPLTNPAPQQERMRFPLEVAAGVRKAWPEHKPLFVRCSSIDDVEGGWSLEDSVSFARELKKIGVDVVDCSSGGIQGS